MPDNPTTEDLKKRLADELVNAPQGTRDSEMPPPGNPNLTGQVGPSPTSDDVPPNLQILPTGAGGLPETGEEIDPGVADAGGVNARNTDGTTRTG